MSKLSGTIGFGVRLLPLLLVGAFMAGCSRTPAVSSTASAGGVVNPARSSRGNPPFYEVFGERYYVLSTSDGFRERGIASWYGRDFHGKPTSGGEIYDMHAMTAAHKTLPIPTWVEVTNLSNGKQVIVKVNDRGPFVDDRIIDLSFSAAEELDMIQAGTARVQIRALGAPAAETPAPTQVALQTRPSAPERPAAPTRRGISIISSAQADELGPGATPFHPLYVQVGAFSDGQNAAKLVDRLKRGGFANSFVLTAGQGADRIHRVRIGPLENEAHFDRVRADLRAVGVYESRLVQDN